MFCMKCGKELPDDAFFCLNCGNEIKKEEPSVDRYSQKANSVSQEKNQPEVKARKSKVSLIISLIGLLIAILFVLWFNVWGPNACVSKTGSGYTGEDTNSSPGINDLCDHEWVEATCESPKTCSICGATEGDSLGHDWGDATFYKPKTCLVCGATEGETIPLEIGDSVFFGMYEQDNKTSNGPEPIEWTVLDIKTDRVLLISKYVLDSYPYNSSRTHVTWEECGLREMLNTYFLESAFTDEETEMIPSVIVTNNYSSNYGEEDEYEYDVEINGGNNTVDKVFCLSFDEILRYFGYDRAKRAEHISSYKGLIGRTTKYAERYKYLDIYEIKPSDYGKELEDMGLTRDYIGKYTNWWLRSTVPISVSLAAACEFYCSVPDLWVIDRSAVDSVSGVRPAIYVKISDK